MNRESLGWSAFFSNQLVEGDFNNDERPSRVTKISRTEVTLHDGFGEFKTTVGGKWFYNREDEVPIVGDWVLVNSENKLTRLLQRRNELKRVHPYKFGKMQSMTANLDQLFIVASCNEDFNESKIERFLTLAKNNKIDPVVVLTKADLTDEGDSYLSRARALTDHRVYLINAIKTDECQKLLQQLQSGQTASLIGSSGVGKSTITNSLLKEQVQKTQAVRISDSKGRHTTTARSLHILPSGELIIDSPGIREIALVDEKKDIFSSFQDIHELAMQCRFSNCRHDREPDCAIRAAINDGKLDPRRFESFLKLTDENSLA